MRWRAELIMAIARRNGQFVIIPNLNLIFAEGPGAGQPRHISDGLNFREDLS
jgi:hypothetical protein